MKLPLPKFLSLLSVATLLCLCAANTYKQRRRPCDDLDNAEKARILTDKLEGSQHIGGCYISPPEKHVSFYCQNAMNVMK